MDFRELRTFKKIMGSAQLATRNKIFNNCVNILTVKRSPLKYVTEKLFHLNSRNCLKCLVQDV